MGYDLHITRRQNWSDAGEDISTDEWLDYVRADAALRLDGTGGPYFARRLAQPETEYAWLDWSDGQIYAKYPSRALIEKMIAIAHHFRATVQGDDGEVYGDGVYSPREPRVSIWTQIAGFVRRLRPGQTIRVEHPPLPFAVGDRVREGMKGREATVVAIDPSGERGLGVIRVRRDDGSEVSWAMLAHDLRLIERAEKNA